MKIAQCTQMEHSKHRKDCLIFNLQYSFSYAFTCSDPQNGPPLFVVHDTALANRSARYEYPLDLSDTGPMLRVFMDLTSFATRRCTYIQISENSENITHLTVLNR